MTKHLRFLIVLLMTLVWSAGWAQEVTMDFTDNTSWKIPTSQTAKEQKFGTGNNEITLSNAYYYSTNYLMLKNGGTLTFTTFTFDVEKIVITGNPNASSNTKQNIYVGNVAVSSQTIGSTSTNTYLIKDGYQSAGNRYVLKVLDKNAQITKIQIYKKESSSNKTSTTLTFPKQSLTYATTDDLKSFTGQTATLTADGTTLTGKTITYSKSGADIFSFFDPTNGTLALNGNAGTATVTATFVGDDTYAEATAKYTLNVVDPNKTDVTFDFTKPSNFGYTDVKIELNEGDKLTKDGFVLENVQAGKYTTRLHEGYLKIYASDKNHPAKGKISLSAPAGCVINRIVFTDDSGSPVSNLTFSIGEIDSNSKTWTGSAKALTMEVAKNQVFIQTMTIYFVKDTETITLNETATNNTIVAKTGVNVTLKRTMAKGVWNTICLPFGLTSEQITTAFGEGVKVAQLDNTNSTGATLKFVDMTNIGMEASLPYLIKPTIDAPADGYKFEGVEITEAAVNPTKVKTAGYLYFNGVYNMVDATTEVTSGYNAAFLGANNTVFGAKQGTNMKGFRAYFAIPTGVKASELRVVVDGTATSIKSINSEVVESNAPVYNLQGQRVDGSNLTPGIYVKAGKKFVVK